MNIPAAIGLAQVERAEWHVRRRREVADTYQRLLRGVSLLRWQAERGWAQHAYWMFTVILSNEVPVSRDGVMARLHEQGVETRPVFYPVHLLPPYREAARGQEFPVAEGLARRGISLPTWAGLSLADLSYVCDRLRECLSDVPGL